MNSSLKQKQYFIYPLLQNLQQFFSREKQAFIYSFVYNSIRGQSFPKIFQKKKISLFKHTSFFIAPPLLSKDFFGARYYFERGVAQYSKNTSEIFRALAVPNRESHYATLHSSIRAGIRSMCYVIGIAGRGRSRGAKREEYTLSSGARVFDQDLSKGLVAPLWPAFRIGITCHCDQKRVSLATNINVPRDAAARSQCASQSL